MRLRTRQGPLCPIRTLGELKLKYRTDIVPNQYDPSILPAAYSVTSPQLSYLTPNGYRSFTESIIDDVGVDGRFRDCTHTVETNEFESGIQRILYTGPSEPIVGSSIAQARINSTEITNLKTQSAPPAYDLSAYAQQALAFMTPTLNEGSSLINFVYELKDLKSWARAGSVINRIRGFAGLSRLERKLKMRQKALPYSDLFYRLPGNRRKMLKHIIERLTGAHLEASFGIVPFIGDIVEAYTTISDLERKVLLLKRYAGKPQVRHYRRILPLVDGGSPATTEWRQLSSSVKSWPSGFDTDFRPNIVLYPRTRFTTAPVYHATMRYKYTVPRMGEVEEKVKTKLDALGVRWDPGIIWDAIPYSFIVDWVADVSGFLHSLARDNFPIETTISDFCHSLTYRYESEITGSITSHPITKFGGTTTMLSAQYYSPYQSRVNNWVGYRTSYSYYNRSRMSPDTRSITIKRPGLKQAALAGSLLINKAVGGHGRARTSVR